MSEHDGWSLMHLDEDDQGTRIYTERIEVPGGWMYRVTAYEDNKFLFMSMCFVPEPLDSK